jgi:hypothetical protein
MFYFSSIIRTALYDEGLGGDLGHGQRGWLLHKPGYEPGASLILRESAEQSVESVADLFFGKSRKKYRTCSNEGPGVARLV